MTTFADEHGEVAATYLAREYHPNELDTISALIRGIRDPELCTELIEAERSIGPRQGVVAELNQRKRLLEENPHLRQPIDELGRRDEPRDLPPKEVVLLDENGEEYDRGHSATSKVNDLQRARTDGGEDR